MNKLLHAGFARLGRDKAFLICAAGMLAFGALVALNQYTEWVLYDVVPYLDNILFCYAMLMGIPCAAFCSLYIGREYSDGTIRNKLIVGHTRSAVYLSNLIVSIAASLLFCLAYLIGACGVGIPLIGFLHVSLKFVLILLLDSFVMTAAFCCLFTLMGMLNQNKAVVAVLSILLVFALLIAASYVNARLSAPEFYDNYVFTDSLGNIAAEQIPNEQYLRGMEREVYQFILDFLPSGQGMQITEMTAGHLLRMPLCSLGISIAATGVGLTCFRRKDIK